MKISDRGLLAVVFVALFLIFALIRMWDKPCPPCPEAMTWETVDTLPVEFEVTWQPRDTTKDAWAAATQDSVWESDLEYDTTGNIFGRRQVTQDGLVIIQWCKALRIDTIESITEEP